MIMKHKKISLFTFIISPIRQPKPKQHRSAISDEVKRQICEWRKTNKNKGHAEIAKHFNEVYPNLTIERSTVTKILLQSDKWLAITNTKDSVKTFRHKAVKFLILDQAMNLWVKNVTAGGVILTDLLIKEKAKDFCSSI